VEIIKYLAKNNLLFSKEKYQHSYPHCWRCDTPLLNYATSSWFVAVTKIKDKILQEAQKISWQPRHIKEGRWGNWLEGARDWSISRQRYWASVIPIWRCDGTTPTGADKDAEGRRKSSCGEMKVVGSISELEKLSGQKVEDLHKHVVDEIVFPCEQCGGTMRRIPDVLDCWFESGSMPYAQAHYPMENKEKFEDGFPAQFIAEGIDQTRAWFYYLHVLATGVMKSIAFENVVVNGIVLAEDGKKMSKRLQNYPDPVLMMEKYGSDSLRYYLMASPVVMAENLNFSEKELSEVSRGLFRMLWNSYSFFTLYATIDEWQPGEAPDQAAQPENLLDRWILSELQLVVKQFNQHMEAYELNKAARLLPGFVDNLSNWYIRRSRRRFWKSEAGDQDKQAAYQTLWQVLTEFSKVVAPFCPFVAEEIYRNLNGFGTGLQTRSRKKGSSSKKGTPESVHLCDFPRAREELIDEELSEKMQLTRQVIEKGLALRAESGIKVRQPLAGCQVLGAGILGSSGQDESGLDQAEFLDLIKDELNVKEVGLVEEEKAGLKWKEEGSLKVGLDTEVTPELALEGQMRELTRQIQEARKKAGFAVEDRIQLFYQGGEQIFKKFSEEIAAEVLAEELKAGDFQADSVDYVADLKIEKEGIRIGLKKS
jgi:isoleucyl-tRNA synthetase